MAGSPFGILPKIHPIWRSHPSLNVLSTFSIDTRRQTGNPIVFGKLREGKKNSMCCLLLPSRILLGTNGVRSAFFKVCLVLIFFLNIIIGEKNTLNPEMTLLYHFHAQKPCFMFLNLQHKILD